MILDNKFNGYLFYQTPVHTIALNAGVEGAVIVGKLMEQDNTDLGYDAAKGELAICITSLSIYLIFLISS